MCTVVYTGWPDMMRRLVVTGGHSSLLTHSRTNIQHSVSIPSMPSSNITPHQNTIISDNYINRYILSPYSLLMRTDLSVSKLHIDHTITGMKIYAYLNVNIIFYSIKFRKLHDHIFLSCLYIYIHNALLLIIVWKISVLI